MEPTREQPFTNGVCPEAEMLLCCVRTYLNDDRTELLKRLLCTELNWEWLFTLAGRHGLLPLVHRTLTRLGPDTVPSMHVEHLRRQFVTNASYALLRTTALLNLVQLFAAHGIPVLPYKGPTLAAAVYGTLLLRQAGDLDLWVDPWDYEFRVPDLLTAYGWRLDVDYGYERTFVAAKESIQVDVHQRVAPPQFPFRLDFSRAWQRRVTISLTGTPVSTLAPADLLLLLCAQTAQDAAAQRLRLIKLCDVAALLQRHPDLDWPWVIQEAQRIGAARILALGLHSAAGLLGFALPQVLQQQSRALPQMPFLITYIRACLFPGAAEGDSYPKLLNHERFCVALRDGLRERIRAASQDVLTPSRHEYALVRLPRALYLCYYVLRAVRLLAKYGRKLGRHIVGIALYSCRYDHKRRKSVRKEV